MDKLNQLNFLEPETDHAPPNPNVEPFPEEAANELARRESFNKHLYRPNTYLHKWWARRSGTTFRHILKHLVTDPAKRDYYAPGGLEGKVVLDPMMGGGTILHEAIRMGANVVGVDIDPIPVLQARATLTLPSLSHKHEVFSRFFAQLREELAPLYQTTCPTCECGAEVQFLLYGLRRRCDCHEVIFVDSLVLRQNHTHDIHICPMCLQVYSGSHHTCESTSGIRLVEKGTRGCPTCGARLADIRRESFSDRYVPLVVIGTFREHGQFFKAVEQNDLAAIAQARALAHGLDLGPPDDFLVPAGPKSNDLLQRGVHTFQDLFTARQLLYLSHCRRLLPHFSDEDRLWLALLVSTSLEFNSLLCGYKGRDIRRPGAIRHVFSHHAYSFPYTALENNPVFSAETSGTLKRLFRDRIARAGEWAYRPLERRISGHTVKKVTVPGEVDGGTSASDWDQITSDGRRFLVLQRDSAKLEIPPSVVDYVVTDPPYYDNVQYSDLSNFFRVWLRMLLPGEADWCYDPTASAVSEGNHEGVRKYAEVLTNIWQVCHSALKRDGLLIFTFHHWSPEAWAALTLSLKRARFELANRYVVFSENPISVHIKGLRSLKHDTILVLRPLEETTTPTEWPAPSRIDTTDSYTFCRDCGSALGWFLASATEGHSIHTEWARLLRGGNGEHTQASR